MRLDIVSAICRLVFYVLSVKKSEDDDDDVLSCVPYIIQCNIKWMSIPKEYSNKQLVTVPTKTAVEQVSFRGIQQNHLY